MTTLSVMLDMNPSAIPTHIYLSQNSENMTLEFLLYTTKGALTVSSGTTGELRGIRNYKDQISISGSVILKSSSSITINSANYRPYPALQITDLTTLVSEPGVVVCAITLKRNNKELSSSKCIVHIEAMP